MVKRAMKFTPQALLSAPRRGAGVPNASGSQVLYTTSTYSFETHKKDLELRVLDVKTGESQCLAHNDDISAVNWLDEDNFVCLQAEKDSTTSVYVASVSACLKQSKLGQSHYTAGKISAQAENLKIAKLDEEGNEFAVVVSAQAGPDGELYNPEKAKKAHSTGRLYDSLYVRHWDRYETEEKNALWYGKLARSHNGTGKFKLSGLTNALQNTGLECPITPFGGTDNFDVSKHGIIFVAKDPELNPALNVKTNVYLIQLGSSWEKGDTKAKLLQVYVPGFEGASNNPVFSPDGTKAAFLSMKTAGYEADKNEMFVIPDVSGLSEMVPKRAFTSSEEGKGSWDRSPSAICFSADGKSILLTAEDYGYSRLYMLEGDLTNEAGPRALTATGFVADMVPLKGGRTFISGSSLVDNSFYAIVDPLIPPSQSNEPNGLLTWSNSNSSDGNKFGLSSKQVDSIWTPASNPRIVAKVHSLVVKPSDFDPSKTYPVAYIIHGGPQGSWGDSWSTRWNLAVFAEQGYIVVAPNPTGSTGYGQAFTDAINRNWGGDPYHDIVNCFEWVGEHMPQADNDRAVALGASYGGYMMNWIQGHELGRKFKALVCHDGIFSSAGMVATEELYFPFYDLGGTPWYDPGFKEINAATTPTSNNAVAQQAHRTFGAATFADWRRWDPAEHLTKWSTPELVIHSSKDFRICISDGLAAFNVLQARGVESQFLTFPDENHWVLKPENSLAWHKVVLNWINKFVGLPAFTEQDHQSEEFWGGSREAGEELTEMATQGPPST